MASAFLTARVVENKQWAENLFSVKLAVKLRPFKAGQFVRVQLMIEGEPMAKPYSLVNSPNQDIAEVFYNIVPNGPMSNALAALKPDDTIEISQPAAGFFVLNEVPDTPNLWMFATGTGLGPYLSILQDDEAWQRFENLVLIHAVSYADNLAYQSLIESFNKRLPKKFRYIPIVSREAHSGALQGRIPALISDGQLEKAAGLSIDPEDTHLQQGDLRFEPNSALVAGDQGMADIRHIVETALNHMLPGGWLMIEHGYQQGERVRSVFVAKGYQQVKTIRDFGGNERVTMGCWGL